VAAAAYAGVTASTASAASAGNSQRGIDLSRPASRKLLTIVILPRELFAITGLLMPELDPVLLEPVPDTIGYY
jgi:hypothetical protein